MSEGKFADVLDQGPPHRFRPARGLGEFLAQSTFFARIEKFLAEISSVGDAIGKHRHDVARVDLDLGFLVVRFRDDAEREPGDFPANLVDCAVGAADHQRRMARGSDRQDAIFNVEHAETEGDKLLLDGR